MEHFSAPPPLKVSKNIKKTLDIRRVLKIMQALTKHLRILNDQLKSLACFVHQYLLVLIPNVSRLLICRQNFFCYWTAVALKYRWAYGGGLCFVRGV